MEITQPVIVETQQFVWYLHFSKDHQVLLKDLRKQSKEFILFLNQLILSSFMTND